MAHGVLEIMNLMGIHEVEPEDYCENEFVYPVYVHLKGAALYKNKIDGSYNRKDFHANPENYDSIFSNYISDTDILMNGVYWEKTIPRLFNLKDISDENFRIKTIADITDDMGGSVPCNIGDSTIADPVYGVDKITFKKTVPYLENSVDVMAVGNLPNELPRDASRYFGEQLIKYVFTDLFSGEESRLINTATIIKKGKLTCSYKNLEQGYDTWTYVRTRAEGTRIMIALISVLGHTLDRKFLKFTETDDEVGAYPIIPELITAFGEQFKTRRQRPIAETKFTYATIFLPGLTEPLGLVDSAGGTFKSSDNLVV